MVGTLAFYGEERRSDSIRSEVIFWDLLSVGMRWPLGSIAQHRLLFR